MGDGAQGRWTSRPVAELTVAGIGAVLFGLSVLDLVAGVLAATTMIFLPALILDVPGRAIGDLEAPWANLAMAGMAAGLYLGFAWGRVLLVLLVLALGTTLATWAVVSELGGHLTIGRMRPRTARLIEKMSRRVNDIQDHRILFLWGLIDQRFWPTLQAGLVLLFLLPYIVGLVVATALEGVFLGLQGVSATVTVALVAVAIVRWRGQERPGRGSPGWLLWEQWNVSGFTFSRVVSAFKKPLGAAAVGLLILSGAPPLLILFASFWVPWAIASGQIGTADVFLPAGAGPPGADIWIFAQAAFLAVGLMALVVPVAHAVTLVRTRTEVGPVTVSRWFLGHLVAVMGLLGLMGSVEAASEFWDQAGQALGLPGYIFLPALAISTGGCLILAWVLWGVGGPDALLDSRREGWLWMGLTGYVVTLYLVVGWQLAVAVLTVFLILSAIWWAWTRLARSALSGEPGGWGWATLTAALVVLYGVLEVRQGSVWFGGSLATAGGLLALASLAPRVLGWERLVPILWYGFGFTIRPPGQARGPGHLEAPDGQA